MADNRQRTDRPADPALPDEITGQELDVEAMAELRSLPKDLATVVSRHLVMAGRLVDEDPEKAYLHAKTARRMASRVALVREANGIAAYQTGRWAEALAELRAARRLSGREAFLPILADCERGLGRPERALSLARSAEAERLDPADRIELRIVEAGARRDMEQYDAAVVTLQIPELKDRRLRPWSARLFYAYADALIAAGREDDAHDWFARAAAADREGETDAAERYAELEGLEIVDTEELEYVADPNTALTNNTPDVPKDTPTEPPPAAEDPLADTDVLTDAAEDPRPDTDVPTDADEDPRPDTDVLTDADEDPRPDTDVLTDADEDPRPDTDVLTDADEDPQPDTDVPVDAAEEPRADAEGPEDATGEPRA